MKFLETRTEIGKAINFKQYPAIRIDVSKTGKRVFLHCSTPLGLEKFMVQDMKVDA